MRAYHDNRSQQCIELNTPNMNCVLDPTTQDRVKVPVRRYSARSPLSTPLTTLTEIFKDIWEYRALAWVLFKRDLQAQHRQTALGYLWILIPILSTTLIWLVLDSANVIRKPDLALPYSAFLLTGTLVWTAFSGSVSAPAASFSSGQSVFMKIRVPLEPFILSGMAKTAFDLAIRTACTLLLLPLLGVTPSLWWLLFPAVLCVACLAGMGIGILLLPLGTLYNDVSRIVGLAMGFAMYACPVVYSPTPGTWLSQVMILNPATSCVIGIRQLAMGSPGDQVFNITGVLLIGLVMSALGFFAMRAVLSHLVERMGM
jgi:lipopolysaccharide transport system permease protein